MMVFGYLKLRRGFPGLLLRFSFLFALVRGCENPPILVPIPLRSLNGSDPDPGQIQL